MNMISDRALLIFSAMGLVPIALSYGVAPSSTVPYLFGFSVEGTNHSHVFRALMGLYLGFAVFWVAGAMRPALRMPALWSMFFFMAGAGAGRVVSILVDGIPGTLMVLYLLTELVLGLLALLALRRNLSEAQVET